MSKFPEGLYASKPHENAPEFVKAKLSIKRETLLKFLGASNEDWINIDLKESKEGKWYCQIDEYKRPEDETFTPSIEKKLKENFPASISDKDLQEDANNLPF